MRHAPSCRICNPSLQAQTLILKDGKFACSCQTSQYQLPKPAAVSHAAHPGALQATAQALVVLPQLGHPLHALLVLQPMGESKQWSHSLVLCCAVLHFCAECA